MKLISCNNCAVILDHDKLQFAENIFTETGDEVDDTKGAYDSDRRSFFAFVTCPVCRAPVFEDSK